MIKFEQLATGTPPDIEVTTDDRNAELVAMTEALESHERVSGEALIAASNLDQATMGEDGTLTFVIPGEEAGQVAEAFDASDAWSELPLQEYLDTQNQRAIDKLVDEDDDD